MNSKKRFILIDDDPESNTLTRLTVNKALGKPEFKIIAMPEKALGEIEAEYSGAEIILPTLLLLEINTATMCGWEFLDAFSALPEKLRKQFTIYILSASIDENDKKRAASHPLISGYLEKPLTKEAALRIYFFNGDFKKTSLGTVNP